MVQCANTKIDNISTLIDIDPDHIHIHHHRNYHHNSPGSHPHWLPPPQHQCQSWRCCSGQAQRTTRSSGEPSVKFTFTYLSVSNLFIHVHIFIVVLARPSVPHDQVENRLMVFDDIF